MTEAAKKLLDAFDSLPHSDRSEVIAQLVRRSAFAEHDVPDDADLAMAADEVFLDLDRRESQQ